MSTFIPTIVLSDTTSTTQFCFEPFTYSNFCASFEAAFAETTPEAIIITDNARTQPFFIFLILFTSVQKILMSILTDHIKSEASVYQRIIPVARYITVVIAAKNIIDTFTTVFFVFS